MPRKIAGSKWRAALSTDTCPWQLFWNKSRCPEWPHSRQLPPQPREALLLSIFPCRGKMVSGSTLKSFAFVIHRLPLKLSQARCSSKENRNTGPLLGTRLNKIELPVGSWMWPMLEWVLPKLAGYFSSCIREKKSGITKTEQAQQLLKAEFSCSLG